MLHPRYKSCARSSVAAATLLILSTPLLAQTPSQPEVKQVASFQHQATGVAVTQDGRIFVSFPRWTEG